MTARVLLISSEGCKFCDEAERLFQRLATEYDLEVETRTTEDPGVRTLALTHGVLFPPGIFIDGTLVQYGRPSERLIRQRLDACGVRRAVAERP